jgi:hypothetical protein
MVGLIGERQNAEDAIDSGVVRDGPTLVSWGNENEEQQHVSTASK